jgi:MtfA peptidase
MFRWWRNRRRRKLLDEPFPKRWEPFLDAAVWQYAGMSEPERHACRNAVQILIGEKSWVGCGGLVLTEEIRVSIAAQAALPILACDHDYYARVDSILVYPTAFLTPNPDDPSEDDELGDDAKEGMAVYRGPVLLSWDTIHNEIRDPDCGHSLVVHEFVHQIDFLDYEIDGTPPIRDRELARRWQTEMTTAYESHRKRLDSGPDETFFTEQAGDSASEFFADAAEAFFCDPDGLHHESPGVYRVLADYFRVEPIGWLPPVVE